jgi:hypothetical protein
MDLCTVNKIETTEWDVEKVNTLRREKEQYYPPPPPCMLVIQGNLSVKTNKLKVKGSYKITTIIIDSSQNCLIIGIKHLDKLQDCTTAVAWIDQ